MGAGFWLNPKTQNAYPVSRHELWVLDPENSRLAGISSEVYEHLKTLNPTKDQDEIRLAAVHAGLIRTRDHGNYVSVQFAARPESVQAYLRSACSFLVEKCEDRFTDLHIDNFENNDSMRISLDDLGRRLMNNEPIMQAAEQPVTPVPKAPGTLRS